MRTQKVIDDYVEELEQGLENVRGHKHKYMDQSVYAGLLLENSHRITTLVSIKELSEESILKGIDALKSQEKAVRAKRDSYAHIEVFYSKIKEIRHRLSTLEWVLGMHERYD